MSRWRKMPAIRLNARKRQRQSRAGLEAASNLASMVLLAVILTLASAMILSQHVSAQLLEFKNRTEGTEMPHGDADMQVLGLISTPIAFMPSSTLYAVFYLPSHNLDGISLNTTSIVLEAREIIPVRNYFMRSKGGQWQSGELNKFGPWPTTDVIDPKGIHPSNLTILARYAKPDGSLVYMPVSIVSQSRWTPSNRYTIDFATSLEIHSLDVTLADPSGKLETLPSIQCNASPICVLYEADSSPLHNP